MSASAHPAVRWGVYHARALFRDVRELSSCDARMRVCARTHAFAGMRVRRVRRVRREAVVRLRVRMRARWYGRIRIHLRVRDGRGRIRMRVHEVCYVSACSHARPRARVLYAYAYAYAYAGARAIALSRTRGMRQRHVSACMHAACAYVCTHALMRSCAHAHMPGASA